MATTSPPSPPTPQPPSADEPPRGDVRSRRASNARIIAIGALALVVLIIAYLVFGSGGGSELPPDLPRSRTARPRRPGAGRRRTGRQRHRDRTDAGRQGEDHDPRRRLADAAARGHQGPGAHARRSRASPTATSSSRPDRTTRRRCPTGRRCRRAPPKKSRTSTSCSTRSIPKTRKGLAEFIQGNAAQYVGAGKEFGESTEYFGPFLSASNHFFAELVRDQPVFTNFLIETAKAVTTIGARAPQLSSLIENANTTFKAIGDQQASFAAGLKELPVTLQEGNKTFEETARHLQSARNARRRVEADHAAADQAVQPPATRS